MSKTASQLLIAIFLIASCAIPVSAKPQKHSKPSASQVVYYAARPEALQFADDLAARRDLDRE